MLGQQLGAGILALGLSCPKLAVPRLVPPARAVVLSDQRAGTVPAAQWPSCCPSATLAPVAAQSLLPGLSEGLRVRWALRAVTPGRSLPLLAFAISRV